MANRYNQIQLLSGKFSEFKQKDLPTRMSNVKYPIIEVDSTDFYVYTTRGDRYDILSSLYYKDTSLWWIIARSNVTNVSPDSLIPTPGIQLRIPNVSRIPIIIQNYENLNLVNKSFLR